MERRGLLAAAAIGWFVVAAGRLERFPEAGLDAAFETTAAAFSVGSRT